MNWHIRGIAAIALAGLLGSPSPAAAQAAPAATAADAQRFTLTFGGAEREYFVRLPKAFDASRTYWLVMASHGAGGNGRTFFLASGIRRYADEQQLDVIVVSPTFSATDGVAQQFPSLGEAAFLDAVVAEVGGKYRVRPKFLMTGYSRGGQFSHRYCQTNPTRVVACAPFAAGSWTTPDGRVIVQGIGELKDVAAAQARSEDLARELTSARVAPAAWMKAAPGANAIPYLVMTGTLDPRNAAGHLFAESLTRAGFKVETVWPVTNHTSTAETQAEFERYAKEAVRFFAKVTASTK